MSINLGKLLAVMAVLSLSACANLQLGRSSHLEDGTPPLLLLSVSAIREPAKLMQVVKIELGGRQFENTTLVTLGPDKIELVALSAMGQKLFTVSYDGQSLTSSDGLQGSKFPVERLMSLMMLALWPAEAVSDSYNQSQYNVELDGEQPEWRFELLNVDPEAVKSRRLSLSDRVIVDIQYSGEIQHWPSIIEIRDHLMNMSVHVTTLEAF